MPMACCCRHWHAGDGLYASGLTLLHVVPTGCATRLQPALIPPATLERMPGTREALVIRIIPATRTEWMQSGGGSPSLTSKAPHHDGTRPGSRGAATSTMLGLRATQLNCLG